MDFSLDREFFKKFFKKFLSFFFIPSLKGSIKKREKDLKKTYPKAICHSLDPISIKEGTNYWIHLTFLSNTSGCLEILKGSACVLIWNEDRQQVTQVFLSTI